MIHHEFILNYIRQKLCEFLCQIIQSYIPNFQRSLLLNTNECFVYQEGRLYVSHPVLSKIDKYLYC